MERLTEKIDGGYMLKIPKDTELSDLEIKFAAYDKLGAYEDAEDKGMLLKLPFLPKPGMKLYDIYGVIENGEAEPREITVRSFNITHARMWYFHINNEVFTFDDFGKTYFLTREEAEAALAELRSTERQRSTEVTHMSR